MVSEKPPGTKPNIRQVAAAAGVSHMTVSRVLNDHPNIKDFNAAQGVARY